MPPLWVSSVEARRLLVPRTMASKSTSRPRTKPARRSSTQAGARWSQQVNETSDALDLKSGVFRSRSASAIARSLKSSAERSRRRKASPFQSAMSMLNFYVNRAGAQLSDSRKHTLERAKTELRALFGREPKRVEKEHK